MDVCVWLSRHSDYHSLRIAELKGVCESVGLSIKEPESVSEVCVLLRLDSGDEVSLLRKAAARSILIKFVVEILATEDSFEKLVEVAKAFVDVERLRSEIKSNGNTFAFACELQGKKSTYVENVKKMDAFGFVFDKSEQANLRDPGVELFIGEEFEDVKSKVALFGKVLWRRRQTGATLWWHKYSLSDRLILGPTTVDNELAFLMVNIASVKRNDIVMDPFVGTGSILIAASVFGARCIGSDLDNRVLRGWGVAQINKTNPKFVEQNGPTDIHQNFKRYNLIEPDIFRSDITNTHYHINGRRWVQAIVTDPPYGIRACKRKFKGVEEGKNTSPSQYPFGRHTKSIVCDLDAIYLSLFTLASKVLVEGSGKLCFLYPCAIDGKTKALEVLVSVGAEFGFSLIAAGFQPTSGGLGRYCVLMHLNHENLICF